MSVCALTVALATDDPQLDDTWRQFVGYGMVPVVVFHLFIFRPATCTVELNRILIKLDFKEPDDAWSVFPCTYRNIEGILLF